MRVASGTTLAIVRSRLLGGSCNRWLRPMRATLVNVIGDYHRLAQMDYELSPQMSSAWSALRLKEHVCGG